MEQQNPKTPKPQNPKTPSGDYGKGLDGIKLHRYI